MVQIYAKSLMKDATINLDRLFHNLAFEPRVSKEAGLIGVLLHSCLDLCLLVEESN